MNFPLFWSLNKGPLYMMDTFSTLNKMKHFLYHVCVINIYVAITSDRLQILFDEDWDNSTYFPLIYEEFIL